MRFNSARMWIHCPSPRVMVEAGVRQQGGRCGAALISQVIRAYRL
ncbi:hypothetical protein [Leucobacter sp. Psy1]|nr:hypothetical protein [Leucobacter sp. Psy1]